MWGERGRRWKGSEEGGKERSGGNVEGMFFYVWGGEKKTPVRVPDCFWRVDD